MKPFHKDNTLFFFQLSPRTNGSLFWGKGWVLSFHPPRALFREPLPFPSFRYFQSLRLGGRTEVSDPPQVGICGLGMGGTKV